MASFSLIDQLVKAAVQKPPLPVDVADLDEQTRRRITAEAERQRITPNALLGALRAQQEEDRLQDEATTAIALSIRARL